MQQLSSLDAQFLTLEEVGSYGNAGFFLVCDPASADGAQLSFDEVCRTISERVRLVPPYTRKLVALPLRVDHPYWVEDDEFEVERHVYESTVGSPGDPTAVAEHVARIVATPLDRGRPLWELHLIRGLEGGKIGLLHKFHHAVADGISGLEIIDAFADYSADGDRAPAGRRRRTEPTQPAQMIARGLLGVPKQSVRAIRSLPVALPNLLDVPGATALPGAATVRSLLRPLARVATRGQRTAALDDIHGPPPRVSFNHKLSKERRFAYTTVPLTTIKAIKDRAGVSFNDVVVGVCASGLRRWLLERGELPQGPLRALVPVSVRSQDDRRTFGNQISTIVVPLPTNESDARQRLRDAHQTLKLAKRRQEELPPGLLTAASNLLPPPIFAQASRLAAEVSGRLAPPVNLIISNIPGPRDALYCHGARVESFHPFTVLMDGVGLNITAFSYRDGVGFGVLSDRRHVDDLWPLIDAITDSVSELAQSSSRSL